jgi:hypothetical protein
VQLTSDKLNIKQTQNIDWTVFSPQNIDRTVSSPQNIDWTVFSKFEYEKKKGNKIRI